MDLTKIQTILLDIEGTTSSISFVKDTLFPYVKENLTKYIEKNWENDELKEDIKILKQQCDEDKEAGVEGLILIADDSKEDVIKNVLWQMDLDRKTKGLKQLQGHVWRDGYASGDLKGHLYPEVAEMLKSWDKNGKKLYVYSSGSVEAQKLLFGNSVNGDLVSLFSGFFDTAVGAKTAKESYEAIVKDIKLNADEILFLTDVVKEAEAAKEAGLQIAIVVREGNAPLDEETKKQLNIITSFEEIIFEPSAKRVKMDEEEEKKTEKTEDDKTNKADEKTDEIKMEAEKPAEEMKAENGTDEEKKVEKNGTDEEKKPENGTDDKKPENGTIDDKKSENGTTEEKSATNGDAKTEENGEKMEVDEKTVNGKKNGDAEPVAVKTTAKEAIAVAEVAAEPSPIEVAVAAD